MTPAFRGLALGLAIPLLAQAPTPSTRPANLQNGDFEEGPAGQVPPGWMLPKICAEAGFKAESREGPAFHGLRAATLFREAGSGQFGNLLQAIDATPYRGKRVRLRAQVRAEGLRAQVWFRVDRPEGRGGGFFDNMGNRPVQSSEWTPAEIVGDVAEDAETLYLGAMAIGEKGRIWLDAVSLEVLGATPATKPEPPRPLTEVGVKNLEAFTKTLGYLRYFHPSDQAAAAQWERLAREGVKAVEVARTPEALARRLRACFGPLAPTAQFITSGAHAKPLEAPGQAAFVVRWRHHGVGLAGDAGSIYESHREYLPLAPRPADWADPEHPRLYELGRGVKLWLPTICFATEARRTLPFGAGTPPPPPALPEPTGASEREGDLRSTRLADVALLWTTFQHFFPYFGVVKADWAGELPRALRAAAVDPDGAAFVHTLRRMTAALKDGHVNIFGGSGEEAIPPIALTLVGGRPVVACATAVPRGSELLSIDGEPVEARLARLRAETSAASPGWMDFRLAGDLLIGAPKSEVALTYRTPEGARGEIAVRRDQTPWAFGRDDRPEKVKELRPGLWYLDLDRLTEGDFEEVLPKLKAAKGVIFDLRGYPKMSPRFLQHLATQPLQSARWNVPIITQPDGAGWEWDERSRWTLEPLSPHISGKVAFLIGGGAISYAESCLGIVEAYGLGALVGEPTAGTNGNINPFTLPGNYSVSWTGMKVLKHDGSVHHGVGILPTVPVHPTVEGLAAGRDEVLERGLEVVDR